LQDQPQGHRPEGDEGARRTRVEAAPGPVSWSAHVRTPETLTLMLSEVRGEDRELYRWQFDALVSWLRCGRRGVIEAVTGSGKTDVAIAAIADALRRDRFVLVVVPSRVLMEQWCGRLAEALPGARIGRLGDSGTDGSATCDVLVATR